MNKLIRVLWAIQKELHTIASCMESQRKITSVYRGKKKKVNPVTGKPID